MAVGLAGSLGTRSPPNSTPSYESARRKPNGLISSQSNKKSLTSKFFGHTNTSSSSETPRSSACLRPPDTNMLKSRLPRSLLPLSKGNRGWTTEESLQQNELNLKLKPRRD
ncbi:unnamed protein product [Arctogadus glacialis]